VIEVLVLEVKGMIDDEVFVDGMEIGGCQI
jgi:hypothetical protein